MKVEILVIAPCYLTSQLLLAALFVANCKCVKYVQLYSAKQNVNFASHYAYTVYRPIAYV